MSYKEISRRSTVLYKRLLPLWLERAGYLLAQAHHASCLPPNTVLLHVIQGHTYWAIVSIHFIFLPNPGTLQISVLCCLYILETSQVTLQGE